MRTAKRVLAVLALATVSLVGALPASGIGANTAMSKCPPNPNIC